MGSGYDSSGVYESFTPPKKKKKKSTATGSKSISTGSKSTSKKTSTGSKQQQVWHFNGKTYTSYAAYAKAVNAYYAALDAQRARNAALQAQAAARARAQRAAAEARRREEERRRALLQADYERQAQERAAAEARRREEERLARLRRQAFERLHVRSRGLLDPRRRNREAMIALQRQAEAERLERPRLAQSEADQTRERLLAEAREQGDYARILKWIANRQRETGGRYLDRGLYMTASDEALRLLEDVRRQREELVSRAYTAFSEENWEEFLRLTSTDEWKRAEARFNHYFGPDRGESRAIQWGRLQQEIAQRQDEWLTRQILGPRTTELLTSAELRRRMEEFEREHLTRPDGSRMTLTQWLRKQDRERRAAEAAAMDEMHRQMALQKELRETRLNQRADMSWLRNLLTGNGRNWDGVMTTRRFEELLRQAQEGLPVDRERAVEELIRMGLDAQRQLQAEPFDLGEFIFGPPIEEKFRKWSELESTRKRLERMLTGQAQDGLVGWLNSLAFDPVVGSTAGNVVKGWETVVGGTSTFARWLAIAAGGGNWALPRVEFDALFGSGNPFISPSRPGAPLIGLDTTEEARRQAAREFAELWQVAGAGDIGRTLDAMKLFGRGWAQGNTAILAEGAIDPFSFIGAGRFLRAGRLAVADIGGLRAALRAPRRTINDFLRLSLPARWGGASESEIRALISDMQLARRGKVEWERFKTLTDEQKARLAEEAMGATFEEVRKQGLWQRLFEENPVQAQQLFSAVSEEAERLARRAGVRQVTAEQIQQDIEYARRAMAQAEIQERALQARAERLAVERAGAEALEKIRAEQARRGVAEPVQREASPLSPFLKGKRTQLVHEFERLTAERVRVAREAQEAMEALEATRDGTFRQGHFERLDRAVQRLRELDDQFDPDSNTVVEGAVSRARQRIRDFDRDHLSGDHAPRFLDVTMPRINADARYIAAQITHARQRLQAASSPGQVRYWARRLKQLGDARDYLEVERRLIRPTRATVRRSMRKYADRVREAIALNRVAARALTKQEGREWLLRDIRRRWYGASVDPEPQILTEAVDLDAVARARDELGKVFLSPELSTTFRELRDQFGAVDPLDLAYALWAARRGLGGELHDTWISFSRAIEEAIRQASGAKRLPGMAAVDRLMELYGATNLAGMRPGLRDYRRLDDRVSAAIREARRWVARGQVRLSRPVKGRPGSFIRHDREFVEIYAKLAALKGTGWHVEAYDQMRSVLGDINLRFNRGESLRRRAEAIAKRTGGSVDEIFDRLRDKARDDEVVNNLEILAYRTPGLSDEELVAMFELQQLDRDLAPFTRRPLTAFQDQALRNAWSEISGYGSIDNQASVRRVLAGAVEPPEGGRLATPADLHGVDMQGIPTFVVPDEVMDAQVSGSAMGFFKRGYGIVLREGQGLDTVLHELGHAVLSNPANASVRASLERQVNGLWLVNLPRRKNIFRQLDYILDSLGLGGYELSRKPYELLTELYALWRLQGAPNYVGRTLDDVLTDPKVDRRVVAILRAAIADFRRLDSADIESFWITSPRPPLGNRRLMHEWMAEHGHFSPRTAEAIRAGRRVYSIKAEREFWEAMYGYTPPWTDPEQLLPVLRNKDAYDRAMREWGIFNNDFERLMTSDHLTAEKLRDAMVFGGEGIKKARTWQELRTWAIERYGDLVWDGEKLTEMPWLMTRAEYDDWIRRAVFDEPLMQASGIEFDPKMVKPSQRVVFGEAVIRATERAFERARKRGEFDGAWLPEEQTRFIMDVVDHMLADPSWRGFFDRTPPGKRLLDGLGTFWRIPMVWTLSFPLLNFLDSYGMKRGILAMTQNGFRPLSRVSQAAKEAFPNVDSLGDRTATWYVRGRNGFVNALDDQFEIGTRAREFGRGVAELPIRVSKFGEDRLRLDFARSMFDRRFDDLVKSGVDPDLARPRAIVYAQSRVDELFPDLAKANAFVRALNQLIPFFSYNLQLKLIGVKLALDNPWLLTMGERLGDFIEEQNRIMWENQYPDSPFPDEDPSARRLWLRAGETTYVIDLGSLSDLTRGLSFLTELGDKTPLEVATEFFRVPHPSQAIFLAWAFGFNDGKTPWGTEARWEDLSTWFDLATWLHDGGSAAFDPNDPRSRDAIQMLTQMLFFKGFGRVTPMRAKVQQYFALKALDADAAREFYNANLDLQAYFLLNGRSFRIRTGEEPVRVSWFRTATPEERAEYEEALAGFIALREALDQHVDQYYLEPWSAEYREAKRQRRALLAEYLAEHPILGDVWGYGMTPAEFADLREEWRIDEMVDAYFRLDNTKPKRDAFGADTQGELDYQVALGKWFDMRRAWLEAHPQVYERLFHARNGVERAWFEQELQWAEILDDTADVKIKGLELQLRLEADPGDEDARALLDAVRELQEGQFALLNAESFGSFYDLVRTDRGTLRLPASVSRAMGRLKTLVTFPGRAELLYDRASPEERAQIRRDERYARGMAALWDRIGNDVTRFYDELKKDPWLLGEYWARNPDKKAAYEAGQIYFNWMRSWVAALQSNDFDRAEQIWNSMPAWVHERYFAKHPDSKMRDGMGGGSTAVQYKGMWFKSPESRDRYIIFVEGSTAVQYDGKWFRSPESRDRYIRWIENGGVGPSPEPFVTMGELRFRSEESRQRFLAGQAYFAAMQRWIDLLRKRDYVAADAYFRALPEWMREKYYVKHPDQRAKNELDLEALRLGAEYFLAEDNETKLAILRRNPQLRAWLTRHGGDEAAMRGLINAIYRAIPSSEAWLKRTFRERHPEIFGEEAAGVRRLRRVAAMLAEHPEMEPFYRAAFALQSRLFTEQLKLNKKPPRPVSIERRRRIRKRTRRRGARFNSRWAMHYELRRGIRNAAGG